MTIWPLQKTSRVAESSIFRIKFQLAVTRYEALSVLDLILIWTSLPPHRLRTILVKLYRIARLLPTCRQLFPNTSLLYALGSIPM
jgi:hypothetical protein